MCSRKPLSGHKDSQKMDKEKDHQMLFKVLHDVKNRIV